MTYIRTKDGKILKVFCENVPLSKEIDGLTYYGENTIDLGTSHWLPKDEILKQANIIEELCDGYYVDVNDQSFTLSECYDNLEDAKKSYKDWISYSDRKYLEYTVILYAFIKTNKGLIYVAKMNGKGGLELL